MASCQVKSSRVGIDAGGRRDGLAEPEELRVRPQRHRDELAVPVRGLAGRLEHVRGERGDVLVARDLVQEPGVRELGDEGRIEAHQVDRVVSPCETAHELLALRVGSARKHLQLDAVRAVRLLRALLRQPALAAVVGIDVPGEYRGPARAVAAGRDQQRDRDHAPAERPEHGYDVERARKVIGSRKGPVMPALGFHAVSWPTVGHVRRAASAASPSCSSARASAAPRQ